MENTFEFTPILYKYLMENGFTHIQLRGIEPKQDLDNTENDDNYILIPWKNVHHQFLADTDLKMEQIVSTDVTDMLDHVLGITFWVELPEDEASRYRKESKKD